MSHFLAYVLVPQDLRGKHQEAEIQKLIGQYHECNDVPEYDRPCSCIGQKAQDDAFKAASKKCGDFGVLRQTFADKHGAKQKRLRELEFDPGKESEPGEREHLDEEIGALWAEHIEPHHKAEAEVLAQHKLKDKPDPKCEECGGSGTNKSTYNLQAKYDCWTIGGRWTGLLGGYDPEKDPENYETCWLCQGSGMRNDELGLQTRAANPNYTCNGCSGKGKSLKFPSKWPNKGNALPLDKLVTKLQESSDELRRLTPFAVVTPEGQWNEKGRMGWFGTVSGEKKGDDWRNQALALFQDVEKQRPGLYQAVALDLHI